MLFCSGTVTAIKGLDTISSIVLSVAKTSS